MDGIADRRVVGSPEEVVPILGRPAKDGIPLPVPRRGIRGGLHGYRLGRLPKNPQKHQWGVRHAWRTHDKELVVDSIEYRLKQRGGRAQRRRKVIGRRLGLPQSLLRDLGVEAPVRVWTDSSAAIGICSRQGLGKLRHIDTHTLWVQQAVRCKRIDLRKVDGETNPADIFTKHSLSRDRLIKLKEIYSSVDFEEVVRSQCPDARDSRFQDHYGRGERRGR